MFLPSSTMGRVQTYTYIYTQTYIQTDIGCALEQDCSFDREVLLMLLLLFMSLVS